MKRIVYMQPNGVLAVVTPAINSHTLVDGAVQPLREAISEDEALQRAIKKLPAYVADFEIIESEDIPSDRTFRDGWIAKDGAVSHDMERCREIYKARLRALRKPKLEALDVAFMRAAEVDDAAGKADVVVKKQALRDVTSDPRIAAATSIEELKAAIPAALLDCQANPVDQEVKQIASL